MLGVMAGIDQKDSCSDMYSAGVAGDYAPRAAFVSLVLRPKMLVIMAGMAQMDSVAQWSFYGPDCSSDLFLPQVQYTMADVPVVQVELFCWFRR